MVALGHSSSPHSLGAATSPRWRQQRQRTAAQRLRALPPSSITSTRCGTDGERVDELFTCSGAEEVSGHGTELSAVEGRPRREIPDSPDPNRFFPTSQTLPKIQTHRRTCRDPGSALVRFTARSHGGDGCLHTTNRWRRGTRLPVL